MRAAVAFALIAISALGATACQQRAADQTAQARRPEQAGQPINPYAIVGHLAGANANMALGDSRAAEGHINAVAHDYARSIRLPDATRPIDHEAARAAVRQLPGVRTAIWLDRANLAVMVDGAQRRSMATIDQVCLALEPLGDTLAVVVNVQDVTAKNADGATTLSRNCQLPEGERALLQAKREADVVPKGERERFKAMQRR
ncbi:MAG: hypothetical protein ABI843_14155 [Dokdonella sp.]